MAAGISTKIDRCRQVLWSGFLPLLLCCLFGFDLSAATISGKVTDSATATPITGVTIKIVNSNGLAVTNSEGIYQFNNLSPGVFTLIFSSENYDHQTITITISNRQTTNLDIALKKLVVKLIEVVVLGKINPRTDRQSRLTEKNSITSLDIASGDLIEHSGSISAGDAVQHIPGVSVSYTNTGNSDKVILRGMEAKYSYALINGFKIPSPDDKSRYISLDIFPAGLLQSVQVYKSLTADMEGDAIGGVVNLVMRSPPDRFLLQAGLGTGYNGNYFNNSYRTFNSHVVQHQSPYERFGPSYVATGADFTKDNLSFYNSKPLPDVTANLLVGDQLINNKLGFIIAADYKNIKTGSNGFFVPLNTQPNLNNVPAFSDYYNQSYNNNKIALSISDELVYQADGFNKFTLSHFYLSQKDIETRSMTDTSLALGRSCAGTGRIYISDRSRVHEQGLNNINLKGNDQLHNFSVDWAGVYSVATGSYPDWSELTANTGRLLSPTGSISQAPLLLASLNRTWLRNREKDYDIYLDLHYRPELFNKKLVLSTGGLLRDKTRDNFYNSYVFSPNINEPFTNIYNAVWTDNNGPQNPLGNINNPNTYTAKERINAYYLMADLQAGKSEFSTGLRLEQTNQTFVSALDPSVSFGQTVSIQYKDWLPDINWKYNLDKNK
ncbi:MAG TPA: carboxypeptidase-like regulatory domain-containing protein, partial [Mucilaginibacter sp.]